MRRIRDGLPLPLMSLALALSAACGSEPQDSTFPAADSGRRDATFSDAEASVGPSFDGGHDGGIVWFDTSAPSTCTPKTCVELGTNCGPVGDGCGAIVECGTCSAPDTCGGGGAPSVCGSTSTCTPKTCADLGANCGPVGNGCGELIASCGDCTSPQICGGGGIANVCGPTDAGAAPCTGLCLKQVACDAGTTRITGIIRNPAGTDPIYGALVYVPNAPVGAITDGVSAGSCDQCGTTASGSPLVSATTDASGAFTLQNAPAGKDIPLVIQLGKWRRQVTLPNVAACKTTTVAPDLARLPKNKSEGNIPKIAMATGNVDSLECVLRKIGIADSEFTNPSGVGRVHLYHGVDTSGDKAATLNSSTPAVTTLVSTPGKLDDYDLVVLACEGNPHVRPDAHKTNLVDYANKGGRIFATHFSYSYLFDVTPFSSTAEWKVKQANPTDPLPATVDQTFTKGQAFAQWLKNVGASTTQGQISIKDPRHDVNAIKGATQRWVYTTNPKTVQHMTFNTPVGASAGAQCGRVVFSDFHVAGASTTGKTFPAECSGTTLTPQERVLEFMLFDLASCIVPDKAPNPTCTKQTCAGLGYNCGYAGDGCGGSMHCGTCVAPETCGGGGKPNVCGGSACTPRTCVEQGIECGPAGDGCGSLISNCGDCPPDETCGGGGIPGNCGANSQPK